MPVGSEDERNVQPLARRVKFPLLQAVLRRQVFGFRLNQPNGDGLRVGVDLDAQGVIHAPFRALARLAVNNLDCPRRLLSLDEVFRPAASVQRGVNQLGAGVGFGQWHGCSPTF